MKDSLEPQCAQSSTKKRKRPGSIFPTPNDPASSQRSLATFDVLQDSSDLSYSGEVSHGDTEVDVADDLTRNHGGDWGNGSEHEPDTHHLLKATGFSGDDRIQSWRKFRGSYTSVQSASTIDEPTGSRPQTLGDVIRAAMVRTAGPRGSQFLPITALDTIVTSENIVSEIERLHNQAGQTVSRKYLNRIADQVLGCSTITERASSGRKKIFAILCLMELGLGIEKFVEEDIWDKHLPFETGPDQNSMTGSTRRALDVCYMVTETSDRVRVRLFDGWKPYRLESFTSYQGWFLAPYFEFSCERSPGLPELRLHHCVVLPFMVDERMDKALGNKMEFPGGCSVVRKVKIHPAHHNLSCSHVQETMYFAVKQLRQSESTQCVSNKRPNPETQAYKRLSHSPPEHTVRLLATFTHDDHLHLVFPWADGNLGDFWFSHYPDLSRPARDQQFARWLSRQFLGLAVALRGIHNSDLDNSNLHQLSPQDRRKTHGRHGDLKPENILWFRHNDEAVGQEESYGIFKICDLGSSDFHAPESKSVNISAISEFTGTYKAPEFDVMKRVSPQYDIWSFGCVLLQFMVWYLLGKEGLDEFTRKRSADSWRSDHPDDFFNFLPRIEAVQAKQSVRDEFQHLREQSNCTDFVLYMLHLIQSSLLRVAPAKRASCDLIAQRLERIALRCEQDAAYCTQRTMKAISKTSSDLSQVVAVEYSEEMKAELAIMSTYSARLPIVNVERPSPADTDSSDRPVFDDQSDLRSRLRATSSVDEHTAVQTPDERSLCDNGKGCSDGVEGARAVEVHAVDGSMGKHSLETLRIWFQALVAVCFGCFRH